MSRIKVIIWLNFSGLLLKGTNDFLLLILKNILLRTFSAQIQFIEPTTYWSSFIIQMLYADALLI